MPPSKKKVKKAPKNKATGKTLLEVAQEQINAQLEAKIQQQEELEKQLFVDQETLKMQKEAYENNYQKINWGTYIPASMKGTGSPFKQALQANLDKEEVVKLSTHKIWKYARCTNRMLTILEEVIEQKKNEEIAGRDEHIKFLTRLLGKTRGNVFTGG